GRIPLLFVDTGIGVAYSRTSWGPDADALMVLFGWRAVDHMQNDVGHVSWWSDGGWKLYEIPDYGLVAGRHNAPSGQPSWGNAQNGFGRIVDGLDRSGQFALTIDITDAYRDTYERIFPFDSVVRSVRLDKNQKRLYITDAFEGGNPRNARWDGPGQVSSSNSGQSIIYTID
ncbi:MAG: hypothetical protein QNJ40_21730, partial [Xanthomonadales bacterium]|nr:hypothetical protein [Xanthomonadales bacterium]